MNVQYIFICYDALIAQYSLKEGEIFTSEAVIDRVSHGSHRLHELSLSELSDHMFSRVLFYNNLK